ncbi:MAG: alpha-galactosidase [Candidatus Cryptobacteroides sp.]
MRRLVFSAAALLAFVQAGAVEDGHIRISTEETDLVLEISQDRRLYQVYFGERLKNDKDFQFLSLVTSVESGTHCPEVYPGACTESLYEPALAVTHNDGNRTSVLRYSSHETQPVDGGERTTVSLEDELYGIHVKLFYEAYYKENVIRTWSEISHSQKKPVTLWRYASSMLHFKEKEYYLTEYNSTWMMECQMMTQPLLPGKKVLDSKAGNMNGYLMQPFFELSLGKMADETSGKVLLGTLCWSGNFQFTFEIDNMNSLRLVSGINPFSADYSLPSGEVFRTPDFIFVLSSEGIGKASRGLHDWARKYQVKDGMEDRYTLLNNWENTYFDFEQEKLAGLMKEARQLGVDLFLLDDGWFGNKYPRRDDHAGLGDWQVTRSKLPGGIGELVRAASEAGVKFGIWIEPEMVNPSSELYEKHPEWAMENPGRETFYRRNQLPLDMSNPKVQDFVFGVVDGIMTSNPDVAFFKWDCNSHITNVFSPYLKGNQGQMYVTHVRGIYNVLQRIRNKYPQLRMMLCSSGGGRADYELLKYFTEFWCSDNTNPVDRLYIQWGYSKFFPSRTLCAHVTEQNNRCSLKFRTDVAMMGKLGFDIGLDRLSPDEIRFCQESIVNWKRLSPVLMDGDVYRLVSPYEGNHASVLSVAKDSSHAVLFAYDILPLLMETLYPVHLQGLDPERMYMVQEINMMPGQGSSLESDRKTFSGDYLMKVGLDVFSNSPYSSRVIEITEVE